MNKFNSSQRIGDIVTVMYKAGDIFKEYGVDFCCGGNRLLSEAIREQGLDEEEILSKLEKAYEEMHKFDDGKVDYSRLTAGELADHIVNTHHVFLEGILPELDELTTKILRVHGTRHSELFRVHSLFHSLKTELEQHLFKEENFLFPLIKEYAGGYVAGKAPDIVEMIRETEDEHNAAGDILKELRRITGHYEVPEDGCSTYGFTYRKLEELEADLFRHIHLENNILFRQVA